MEDEASIKVGQSGEQNYIRVFGRGSFKNAQSVKSYVEEILGQGRNAFVFDMAECTHMDSTFMGMLAGLAIRLKKEGAQPPTLLNLGPKNFELLEQLGIHRILDIPENSENQSSPEDCSPQNLEALEKGEASKEEVSRTMLDAHETLANVDEANAVKFEDVISFLRKRVEQDSK